MSLWFHRNVLKATTLVDFTRIFCRNLAKLGSDLNKARERLLHVLPDPSQALETINTAYISYMSMMSGFFMDFKISGKKIRYAFTFKWTHSILGSKAQIQQDAAFDIANMSINVALWHMKHASYIAAKKKISFDSLNDIHTILKKAASIFQMVLKDILPILEQGITGSDLDARVLNAYVVQAVAEAQEITVAKAIDLRHNDKLISALAYETSNLFKHSRNYLMPLDKSISEQWVLYLEIKACIYLAYAYCFSGKNLLNENHFREGLGALKESQVLYKKGLSLCKSYSKVKVPAKPVKPDGHIFFKTINSTVNLLLEKCQRKHNSIYHEPVHDAPLSLEKTNFYSLLCLEAYNLLPPAPLWTNAFQNHEESLTLEQ